VRRPGDARLTLRTQSRQMASKGVKKETLHTLSRQPLLGGDLEPYMKVISGESDRACALVASSFVEHSLVNLLRAALIELTESEDSDLFVTKGAVLGNFAGRIDIAYALGITSKEQTSDLDIVRTIRNAFAHAVKAITFADPLVKAECGKFKRKLICGEIPTFDEPRHHYSMVCHTLAIELCEKTIAVQLDCGKITKSVYEKLKDQLAEEAARPT
jgi:hypothetical protein